MSNLTDAIEHLEDAEEAVDTEAEIDEAKRTELLAMVDQIRQCKHDLEELAGEE